MSEKVVFLDFKKPETTDPDTMAFIACSACRNKTYTITEDKPEYFPLIRCAACGCHIGRMGWAPDNGEEENDDTE